jgi:hypothetical protein
MENLPNDLQSIIEGVEENKIKCSTNGSLLWLPWL